MSTWSGPRIEDGVQPDQVDLLKRSRRAYAGAHGRRRWLLGQSVPQLLWGIDCFRWRRRQEPRGLSKLVKTADRYAQPLLLKRAGGQVVFELGVAGEEVGRQTVTLRDRRWYWSWRRAGRRNGWSRRGRRRWCWDRGRRRLEISLERCLNNLADSLAAFGDLVVELSFELVRE
jgi:hypothetical protein